MSVNRDVAAIVMGLREVPGRDIFYQLAFRGRSLLKIEPSVSDTHLHRDKRWSRNILGMNIPRLSMKSKAIKAKKPLAAQGVGRWYRVQVLAAWSVAFYLHKNCAEAPLEINHPFHRKHPLVLMPTPPYGPRARCFCDFCGRTCKMFVYHCSCGLDFHIKCALFSCTIAEKNFGELEHIVLPWISIDEQTEELESAKCFGCWNPLLESTYFSLDCRFNLHKKCVELSPEINHFSHQEYLLVLQCNGERFSSNVSKTTTIWFCLLLFTMQVCPPY
ncbi:Uncharacterized protein TCM_020834 [Theobroma cacao]|uniref:Cysteine/Histidine-rich C1 domain family protein n=1 Tax=Theobroma cacao TaxID=3641 RepID=A0A061EUL5_THECC|nr:Uncharacterized protein TCM_020834 [Theobroma cacao]